MLPTGTQFRALCDVYADEDNTGIVIYFYCNDGGRGAMYLDRTEIEQRGYQFEGPTHAPVGAALQ